VAAKPRILIVGAGPCGLTAALELSRRGFSLRIIDSEPGPTPLSKAVGISPRSLEILEPSGVTEQLLARGVRIRGLQARYHDDVLATIDLSGLPHRFNFLLSLAQSETERVMEAVLATHGVQVEWNVELKAIAVAGDKAEVELELAGAATSSERATFEYVFAADGAHSRVRDSLGIDFSGYTHRRIWSIADATIPDWAFAPDMAMATLHDNGDIGFIIPIGAQRFRAVSNTPEALGQIPGVDSAQVLQRDTFKILVRQADRYQRGCVFLGGDAAHVHSPVGARGMNLGIEDAFVFARRFAERTLEGYTAERYPVGHRWILLSERLLAGVQASHRLVVPARNLAIRMIGRIPALQRTMMERVAGLRE
jgi:2-polyprenyl-6-methoxyphenol hydroxylase-like FAD-dependent oxidoreductase